MANLKRKTPRERQELKSKLDGMEDSEVLDLFEGIGTYIKEHFVEVDDEGNENGGRDNAGSGNRSDGNAPSGFAKFFGATE